MRDHRKLKAFELADTLALRTYQATVAFPKEERYALVSQMRRAAVSIASNIVEGCSRRTQADFVRFLELSHGSARELAYQVSLASRLGYLAPEKDRALTTLADETSKVIGALINRIERDGIT